MSNSKVFCNTPWYELHIYWDGSLGICCQENHKIYKDGSYNISNMTIAEWYNSQPVRDFRLALLGNQETSICSRCTRDEQFGVISRRLRSNQKSAIFTLQAFNDSYAQSPGHGYFEHSRRRQGNTTTSPVDLHIDLGNYCNLACKMCNASASSTIASQEVRWGLESSRPYLGQDWTRDSQTWQKFLNEVVNLPSLNNLHFMGGETLLTPRFEQLVDYFIDAKRFDVCFSFVTNGTVFNPSLLEKLKKFKRVGIEVSIETIDNHNAYQRQGTDTDLVLANIDRYLDHCNGTTITVTLRSAPSLLSVGYYTGLLKYALDRKLTIKSNTVYNPSFLYAGNLPTDVKNFYMQPYCDLVDQLSHETAGYDYNHSDPNNYAKVVKEQAQSILNILRSPQPENAPEQWQQLVKHCKRWDQVYGYNARTLYPELKEIWDRYEY